MQGRTDCSAVPATAHRRGFFLRSRRRGGEPRRPRVPCLLPQPACCVWRSPASCCSGCRRQRCHGRDRGDLREADAAARRRVRPNWTHTCPFERRRHAGAAGRAPARREPAGQMEGRAAGGRHAEAARVLPGRRRVPPSGVRRGGRAGAVPHALLTILDGPWHHPDHSLARLSGRGRCTVVLERVLLPDHLLRLLRGGGGPGVPRLRLLPVLRRPTPCAARVSLRVHGGAGRPCAALRRDAGGSEGRRRVRC
mmetsp:Transcript_36462/g.102787  ORF Transcript_36462/g.102787 Transcript_36462/m.102787 type:complete len:252 (-) Transcript_36462:171-926(-)